LAPGVGYISTHEGWLFLAAIVDCYSRKVVGWSMRDDLKAELVVDALAMAVTRRPPAGLVHHSDRGSQYGSLAFGRTLRESGLLALMGSRGDAFDNALAESFISRLKCELIRRQSWASRDQARLAVFEYIETFYNPHVLALGLDRREPGLGTMGHGAKPILKERHRRANETGPSPNESGQRERPQVRTIQHRRQPRI
jgi:putative transposase